MDAKTSVQAEPRLRVLIIEDNPDAAGSLQYLLELHGNDVRVAYTGTDGVLAALAWEPKVVLCDIGLPGMNGWEVARQLRRNGKTKQLRLIAVTSYGSEEDRSRSMEAGFDYHLTKPVDPEVLTDLMAS